MLKDLAALVMMVEGRGFKWAPPRLYSSIANGTSDIVVFDTDAVTVVDGFIFDEVFFEDNLNGRAEVEITDVGSGRVLTSSTTENAGGQSTYTCVNFFYSSGMGGGGSYRYYRLPVPLKISRGGSLKFIFRDMISGDIMNVEGFSLAYVVGHAEQ